MVEADYSSTEYEVRIDGKQFQGTPEIPSRQRRKYIINNY